MAATADRGDGGGGAATESAGNAGRATVGHRGGQAQGEGGGRSEVQAAAVVRAVGVERAVRCRIGHHGHGVPASTSQSAGQAKGGREGAAPRRHLSEVRTSRWAFSGAAPLRSYGHREGGVRGGALRVDSCTSSPRCTTKGGHTANEMCSPTDGRTQKGNATSLRRFAFEGPALDAPSRATHSKATVPGTHRPERRSEYL